MHKILVLLVIFMVFSSLAFAETFVLKSGLVLEGKIIEQTSQYIKVDIGGVAVKYYLDTVKSINGQEINYTSQPDAVSATAASTKERIFSENWLKHYALAEQHLENRQYEEALLEFNNVLGEDPAAFEAYTGIGFVNIQQGNYDAALANFKKAIAINSEYVQAYDNIGVVHSLLRQYREAIPYFEKAIHIDPEYVAAYNNLGSTYVYLGQYQHAVIYYQKAFQIDPQNANSAYNLGVAYYDLGKNQEAKDYLEKAKVLYQAQGNYYGEQKTEDQLRKILQDSQK